MPNKTGILLMTYGSATTADNVAPYLQHIYKGKASPELIKDFENRYELVGGSPLVGITKQQAALLENFLGNNYVARAAMLHSVPFIDDVVLELKNAGATQLKGIILSPQFSSFIMQGYSGALLAAAQKYGFSEKDISVAPAWPSEPHFIELLASRVCESLQNLEKKYGQKTRAPSSFRTWCSAEYFKKSAPVPVLFTTHSLPKRVVEKDPDYLRQLQETINAVVAKLHNPGLEYYSCYQSAGHTPEEWLKPDLTDILDILAKKNVPAVLIAPIQFLADHLEILYDLDIAARQQCTERNIAYYRIELPNTHPLFIEALANIAKN